MATLLDETEIMHGLTTAQLGQACRIFMDVAYPAGPGTIPPKKQAYYAMDASRPLEDYLPPSSVAAGIGVDMAARRGGPRGYEFRLGSAHYPCLKLNVQLMEHRGGDVWVWTVDTHDAFSRSCSQPPPDHPDATGWVQMQDRNRQIKEQVEEALEHAGYQTFKSLLRLDLNAAPAAR